MQVDKVEANKSEKSQKQSRFRPSRKITKRSKTNWKAVLPLCLVLLIDAMSFGLVLPEFGPLFLHLKGSILPLTTKASTRYFLYSLTLAMPLLFLFVGASVMGSLSDRIGRKRSLLIALVGISFSCLVCAVGVAIGSITILILGRALIGVMDGNEAVAQAAMADISDSSNKVINMAFVSLAGTVGFAIGPVLGGYLVDTKLVSWFDYLTPFYFAAFVCALNAILLFFFFKETFVVDKNKIRPWVQNVSIIWESLRAGPLRSVSITFFFMEFAWGLYFQTISILLVHIYHYNAVSIGHFLSVMSLVFVVTLLIIMRLFVNYFSSQTIIKIGLAFVLVGVACMFVKEDIHWVYIALMPLTIGVGLCYNNLLALFSENASDEMQGQVMGLSISLVSLSWLLAAILGGILAAYNVYLPYIIIGVSALIGYVSMHYYPKKQST